MAATTPSLVASLVRSTVRTVFFIKGFRTVLVQPVLVKNYLRLMIRVMHATTYLFYECYNYNNMNSSIQHKERIVWYKQNRYGRSIEISITKSTKC